MTAIAAVEPATQNLTFAEQVIKEHPAEPLAPLAGHVVVVFEKKGAGEEFRLELRDGQRAPRAPMPWEKFFGQQPQYIAFAVTSELQRTTRVTVNVTMDVGLHVFGLAIDIIYRVGDPRAIVARRSQDPLKKIRDEAARLIVPELAKAGQERLRTDFRGVVAEIVFATLARVQNFASDYGIFVKEIALNPAKDIEKLKGAEGLALDEQLQHELLRLRAELERERKRNEDQAVIAGHDVTSSVANIRRYDEIGEAAARTLIKAIETAGTAIHTPADLAQAVGTIRDAIEALRDVGGGSGTSRPALPASAAKGALAPVQTGAGAVIAELLGETEAMNWPSLPIKTKLQGATLHLIAELMMPDATDETITGYRERLSDARTDVATQPDHFAYFAKFIDSDRLRRRLT